MIPKLTCADFFSNRVAKLSTQYSYWKLSLFFNRYTPENYQLNLKIGVLNLSRCIFSFFQGGIFRFQPFVFRCEELFDFQENA